MTCSVIDYKDFLAASQIAPAYYHKRWPFIAACAATIQPFLPENPEDVLEVGPYYMPAVKGAHTLDTDKMADYTKTEPTYRHDATQIPWPIPDKRYKILIAFQVWEHLRGCQGAAFKEAERVADIVVLSLPYNWPRSDDCHAGITDALIFTWAGKHPALRVVVDIGQPRIILVWRSG